MLKPLSNLPVLDTAALRESTSTWSGLAGPPGSDRVVVEWGVMRGPNVFVFPAAKRSAGIELVTRASSTSDERWADYMELTFIPEVIAALQAAGHRTQAICVDLRPLQIQRTRRRTIEAAAHARTGHTVHLAGEDEVFNDSEIVR